MERWSVDRKMRRNVKIADIDPLIKSCVVSSQNQGIEYNVIFVSSTWPSSLVDHSSVNELRLGKKSTGACSALT